MKWHLGYAPYCLEWIILKHGVLHKAAVYYNIVLYKLIIGLFSSLTKSLLVLCHKSNAHFCIWERWVGCKFLIQNSMYFNCKVPRDIRCGKLNTKCSLFSFLISAPAFPPPANPYTLHECFPVGGRTKPAQTH